MTSPPPHKIAYLLDLFERSTGKTFVILGYTDTIVSIDRENQTVIGKAVEATITWCELKTKAARCTKQTPAHEQELF